jgi:iron complex outermembrane receptor protein
VQGEDEVGASARLSGRLPFLADQSRWQLGAIYAFSTNDAKTFANNSGARGELRTRSDQDSDTLTV